MSEFWNGYPECKVCKASICLLIGGSEPITVGKCPALGKQIGHYKAEPETGIRCAVCNRPYAIEGKFTGLNGRTYLRQCNWCGQLSILSCVSKL